MKNRMFSRPCPLCGALKSTVLTELSYALFDDCPLHEDFLWCRCNTCGFTFNNTTNAPADFDKYYQWNTYYFSSSTSGSGGSNPFEIQRYIRISDLLKRYLTIDSPVFDIGSGKGGLLQSLTRQGFTNVYAVDPLQACVDYLNNTTSIKAQCGRADSIPFKPITPSILIYSHVLEHLYSPVTALREAFSRLDNGGLIYIEVPDALRYGVFSNYPLSELYLEHINHFDLFHLEMMANISGFEKIESGQTLFDTGVSDVPCIWGLFRKTQYSTQLSFDNSLSEKNELYIAEAASSPAMTTIQDLALDHTPLFLWGISQYAQLLLGSTDLQYANIKGLIDGDIIKQSRTLRGRAIESPEILRNADENDIVLLTGINYQSSMIQFLDEIGFKGEHLSLQYQSVPL